MFDNILKFVIAGLVKLMQKIIPAGLYIGTVNEVRSELSLYRRPVGISFCAHDEQLYVCIYRIIKLCFEQGRTSAKLAPYRFFLFALRCGQRFTFFPYQERMKCCRGGRVLVDIHMPKIKPCGLFTNALTGIVYCL